MQNLALSLQCSGLARASPPMTMQELSDTTDPAQRMPGFSVKGAEGGKTKTTHEENYFRCVHSDASHSGLKIWRLTQRWRQVHASVFKMTLNDLVHVCLLVLWGVRPRTPTKFFTLPHVVASWFDSSYTSKLVLNITPPHFLEFDSRVFVLSVFCSPPPQIEVTTLVVNSFWLHRKFQVLQALQTTWGGLGSFC